MDQKPIVLYLRMKGMALDAIHDDLVRTLGKDAVAYSTVTKYVRNAQFSGRKEATSRSSRCGTQSCRWGNTHGSC
jgi:hypothetical protein